MANVNSVNSNNSYSTSLYGNRNVLSGLASGLDTESMIENSVSGYRTKISQLQQQQEKLSWKQDAYRGITDKMVALSTKYTSYTSATNLTSPTFFSKSVNTVTGGTYADLVSATGKASSDITLNAVHSMATAARYAVDASALNFSDVGGASGSGIDWGESVSVGTLSGSLSFAYGSATATIRFDEKDNEINSVDALKKAIEDKLAEVDITVGGETIKASERIKVSLDGGRLTFTEQGSNAGEGVYINGVSGNLGSKLGVAAKHSWDQDRFRNNAINLSADASFVESKTKAEYLSGRTLRVTLAGATKTVTIGQLDAGAGIDDLVGSIQSGLDSAFGAGKVLVSKTEAGGLTFGVPENSGARLSVTSDAAKALGFGDYGVSNYFNTARSLGALLGESYFDGEEKKALTINGVNVGEFGKDDSLETVMNAINRSAAGVSVSFSNLTGQFTFTAKETGSNGRIDFSGELGNRLFKPSGVTPETSQGTDAVVTATVNGKELTLTRSGNSIEMDGLTVNLKGTFNTDGSGAVVDRTAGVTFTTQADSDKLVDIIKSFVNDYNAIMKEIHDAYSTAPLTKSGKTKTYEPLTEQDKADMSENAITKYEEKAKTGLLFGDSDLSSLYNKLESLVASSGQDRIDMESIGLTTTYSNGLTQINLNESRLRSALESDPGKVQDVFTKTKNTGSSSDGIMARVKSLFNTYASTSVATPGILVKKAGTTLSSLSLTKNTVQKQIDKLDAQISSWETKLSAKVDYYTRQFSALEQLMSTMNNQSSMLAGMMGG